MNSNQCLITRALDGAIGMNQFRRRVKNPAKFYLDESSDKAQSAKHAYQAELERPDGLSALLFQGSGREPEG